mgnify:FL=1
MIGFPENFVILFPGFDVDDLFIVISPHTIYSVHSIFSNRKRLCDMTTAPQPERPLTLTYDPLLKDLASAEGPLNRKEATELFQAINDDIKEIRKPW